MTKPLRALLVDVGNTLIDVTPLTISFDVGFCKPNPAIFEAALALLNVSPDEAAMVCDDLLATLGAHTCLACGRSGNDPQLRRVRMKVLRRTR